MKAGGSAALIMWRQWLKRRLSAWHPAASRHRNGGMQNGGQRLALA